MDRSLTRRQVARLGLAGAGALALAPLARPASVQAAPATTWYFAEGSTGQPERYAGAPPVQITAYSYFDEYLTIVNPAGGATDITLTYCYPNYNNVDGGSRTIISFTTQAKRTTVEVHKDPANRGVGRNVAAHATIVQASRPVVVERPMYFSYLSQVDGGHVALGATAPASTWYFAEGWTGAGFDEYLAIFNPNNAQAAIEITYYLAGGGTETRSVTANKWSRETVPVHEAYSAQTNPGGIGRDKANSIKVRCTNGYNIVVERAMYFTYGGSMGVVTGGHIAFGVPQPRTNWYFAEGYTNTGFDEYLTIQNPNGAGTATITYHLASGSPVVKSINLPANSRTTVAVHNANDPGGLGRLTVGHATQVLTTVGTVVERPMYFAYSGSINGGHDVMGAEAPRPAWYFAEGYTGTGFDEYLTVQSPNSTPITVRVTYYPTSGSDVIKTFLEANSRRTITVYDPTEGVGRGVAVSALVESTDATKPIIAERPIYFSYTSSVPFPGRPGFTANGGSVALGSA